MISSEERDKYRELLKIGLDLPTDESFAPPAVQNFVVPQAHVRALDPDVELVRGGRGVGKSTWYLALTSSTHREVLETVLETASRHSFVAVHGFGVDSSDDHPDRDVIEGLLDTGFTARAIWQVVLMRHVRRVTGDDPGGSWLDQARALKDDPGSFGEAMRRGDAHLAGRGETLLVLFDALDRTARTWDRRRQLLQGLLEVLLDAKGTRYVRGKAFVRPDMLDYGGVLEFPDASKLSARAVDLEWRPRDLYRLLWQRLGNADGDVSGWFRGRTGEWEERANVFNPPRTLTQSDEKQRDLFHEITGPFMGANHRRGYPYSWLPKHLADSRQQVSPRSFLIALQAAAQYTVDERVDHPWPLHYEAIKQGVQNASRTRVDEIREDVAWIDTALKPLEGLSVPCANADLALQWREAKTLEQLANLEPNGQPQRLREGAVGLREELGALGVLEQLNADRVNMADVYRVAFRLGRRGGVKPLG